MLLRRGDRAVTRPERISVVEGGCDAGGSAADVFDHERLDVEWAVLWRAGHVQRKMRSSPGRRWVGRAQVREFRQLPVERDGARLRDVGERPGNRARLPIGKRKYRKLENFGG